MGFLAALIPAVVRGVEALVVGRKKGATKKSIALQWIEIAQRELAKDGTIPAVVPSAEVASEIDDVVNAMNKLGTMPMGSAGQIQQGLFTGLEVLQFINAFSLAVKNASNPPQLPPGA